MTVRLDPELESALRRRSAALGLPASALVREALTAWLESNPEEGRSAFELGEDLFGRFEGPGGLADTRKEAFADIVQGKHADRSRRDGG